MREYANATKKKLIKKVFLSVLIIFVVESETMRDYSFSFSGEKLHLVTFFIFFPHGLE